MKISRYIASGLMLAAGAAGVTVWAADFKPAVERPAVLSAKASKTLSLDIAQAGNRLVAVGERGHILFSDDSGKSWNQASVPVSVLLTGVYFSNEREGWAVGHDGVILHTTDSGQTWNLQRKSELSASDCDDGGEAEAAAADNCNKAAAPLLKVWFSDDQNGFAVGSYGYFLKTQDGGNSWEDYSAALANPDGLHLNSISAAADESVVFIAGESGQIFRSLDKGTTWQKLDSPFDGSFFGITQVTPSLTLVYGLQGKLYASGDKGNSWLSLATGVMSGLNMATTLENGDIVVAGNAGVVLRSPANSLEFIPEVRSDRQSISAIVAQPGGGFVTAGEGGLKSIPASGQ